MSRIGLVLVLSACGGGDDGGDGGVDSGNDGGSTGGPGTTTMGMSSTNAMTMGDTSNGSVDDSTGGGGSVTEATTSATSDTGAGATDDPTTTDTSARCEPTGEPCGDCIAMSCCDETMACQADVDCACVLDCIGSMMGDAAACSQMCKVNAPPPQLQDLADCVSASCGGSCN